MENKDETQFGEGTKILWQDRKRWCGLPWSFTRYYIVEKKGSWLKLFTSVGLFGVQEEEVNVYRIYDLTVTQSLSNRMFKELIESERAKRGNKLREFTY